MTPDSSFQLSDDGTEAWLVVSLPVSAAIQQFDRPCDNKFTHDSTWDCPNCDDTGRYTFTIEVGDEEWHCEVCNDSGISHTGDTASSCGYCPTDRTYRVHVLDVLPIYDNAAWDGNTYPVICLATFDPQFFMRTSRHARCPAVSLPPDAAPGKWAVRMAVHS